MRLPALLCLSSVLVAADPLPHERPGAIAVDPAITWGALPNGLRYAVMANHQPVGKAVLRLRIAAGSLNERDDQLGLAHLLEHLAFNGTTHYPPGRLVTDLQHLGLQFGAHTNAHTSFDETVYKLDLPDASTATLTTGLTVLGDWAGGQLLPAAEVERERGVVLAEARDRDGWNMRTWRARFAARYAGTRMAERFPIGTPACIQAADRTRLAEFYDRWYRPQDMLLVVVADAEPAAVVPLIAPALAGLADRGGAAVAPAVGTLTPSDSLQVLYHHEAEAEDTAVGWSFIASEATLPCDDLAHQRRGLVRALAARIFDRRIQALIEADANGPLLSGGLEDSRWLIFTHAAVEGRAKPGKAREALALLIREGRRLLQYGPTAEELASERAAYANELDTAVAQAADRRDRELADGIVNAVAHGEVVTAPAQDQAQLKPLLPGITGDEVMAELAAWRRPPGRELVEVCGREDLGADGMAQVEAAARAALTAPVEPPAQRSAVAWAYASDPQAPLPAATLSEDAAAHLLRAAMPGVAVTVKATGFQPGRVLVSIRLPIAQPPNQAVAGLAASAFLAGGLGRHAADEEERLFAGTSIGISCGIDDGSVVFSGSCPPGELGRCLDRLRAHLLDPGWRENGYRRAIAAWDEQLTASERDPAATAGQRMAALMVGNDRQRRPATRADLATLDVAAVRAWLAPALAAAPLAIVVVGDLPDAAAARDAVLRRFAARPGAVLPGPVTDGVQVRPHLLPGAPPVAAQERLTVQGSVPKAVVRIAWPTDDLYDIGVSRRRNLLAACLGDRLREDLRQRLGAAYSPGAGHSASETRRGEGWLVASAQVEPAQTTVVEARILALAAELARDGVSADLCARMRAPVVKSLSDTLRRDDWWLGTVLARLPEQQFRLTWATQIVSDYSAIDACELSALAQATFVPGREIIVVVTAP